jgi:uracil-DNA glycosylase family 4
MGVEMGMMGCISKNCSAKVEEEYPQEEYWNGCMLVGEAPGKEEHRRKIPFVGDSGKDLDNYLRVIGQSRLHFYTTNICKCFVQGNPDPTPHQILECTTKYLIPELEYLQPKVIGAMGLIAVRWFLCLPPTPNEEFPTPLKMEEVHGIPFLSPRGPWVVVPIYHPASGLRFPDRMLDIRRDFQQLKLQITGGDGKLKPRVDISGKKYNQKYNYSANGRTSRGGIPAIDTETDGLHGKFWCMSYSNGSRSGGVIRNPIPHTVPKAIFHNAIYDIPVLKKVNVNVREWVCTMTMAYLLQLPQSLKLLSYRLLNIRMEEYGDVVGNAGEGKALTYLCEVLVTEWPNPEPLLTWDKGQPHIKKPQNIAKKVQRMLNDKVKGECGERDPVSLYTRWNNIKPDEGRGVVEEVLGVMPEGYLGDIPLEKAVQYAGLDADVTRQLYPILQAKIEEEELEEVLDRDMRMMPLVLDMMEAGILIEGEYIAGLSTKYRLRMSKIENEIHTTIADIWEGHFNPGSPKQTGELMLQLGLLEKKYGKLPSTEAKYLEAVRHKHPVVSMILDWRGYKKLDSTYVSVLPKLADEGGRVHTTFKTTRTATGRLASENPNLMNQPVRSTEGKELRNGFVAGEGCVLVSLDYCVVGDTEINTNKGVVQIQDVIPGMGVLSLRGGNELVMNPITVSMCVGELPVFRMTLEDGSSVECTEEHSWITYTKEKKRLKDLSVGDRLAHVKSGINSPKKYPTWYIGSHFNYKKNHILVADFQYGPRPDGHHVDHIDRDVTNWCADNLRYLPAAENYAQGGRRYWKEVKSGERSDTKRLECLQVGLENRRSYNGKGNPNHGKHPNSSIISCTYCGKKFRRANSAINKKNNYCNQDCYFSNGGSGDNHRIVSIEYVGIKPVYQITVQDTHNYVLANGLVSCNSQIELRILAHVSGDENMIKIFRSGGDIHSMTAASMFRIPLSEVDKDKHRRPAKNVAFGIVYGITAMGLFMQFELEGVEGWTVRSCRGLIDGWLDTYPGVRGYTNTQHTMAKRYGKVWDLFGRVRYIPEVLSSREWVVESGLRKAGNTPIQSGAQGVIKEGMAQLVPECEKWRKKGYTVNPLIQTHDDLLFEIGRKEVGEVVPKIKHIMEHVVELDVETPVDCKAGVRWGSMKDVDVGGEVETLLRKLVGKEEK